MSSAVRHTAGATAAAHEIACSTMRSRC